MRNPDPLGEGEGLPPLIPLNPQTSSSDYQD